MNKLIFVLPLFLISCKKEEIKPFEFPKVIGNSIEIKLDGTYLLLDGVVYVSDKYGKSVYKHFNDNKFVSKLKPNSVEPFDLIVKDNTMWTFKSPSQNFQYGEFTVKNNGVEKSLPFYVTPSNWTIGNKPIVNARVVSIQTDTIVEFTTYVQTNIDNSYHFSVLKFKKIK